LWNLGQLAQCLTLVCDVDLLEKALEQYEPVYRVAFRRRMLAMLGLKASTEEADLNLLKALFGWMGETRASWPQVFFDWFCGPASEGRAWNSELAQLYRKPAFEAARAAILSHDPERPERLAHTYFSGAAPASMLIEEVEALWDRIAENDDWAPFNAHVARIETSRQALDLL
jgi:uncharacterized protein YdiU (UPF0061 family)